MEINDMKLIVMMLMVIFLGGCKKLEQPQQKLLEWSEYKGKMNWDDAKVRCAGLEMRLPTTNELVAVYKSRVWKEWQKEDNNRNSDFWTSEKHWSSESLAYSVNMSNGDVNNSVMEYHILNVRCVR